MQTAFKEWAAITRALGAGSQSLILRKGGIEEHFQLRHGSFLLFPTYEHQNPEDLNETGKRFLGELKAFPIPVKIEIEFFGRVTDEFWIETLKVIKRLEAFHAWSEKGTQKKFDWAGKGLHVFMARIFRLPESVFFEPRPQYAGCRSWIELESDVDVRAGIPVLSDAAYEAYRCKICQILEPYRRNAQTPKRQKVNNKSFWV